MKRSNFNNLNTENYQKNIFICRRKTVCSIKKKLLTVSAVKKISACGNKKKNIWANRLLNIWHTTVKKKKNYKYRI